MLRHSPDTAYLWYNYTQVLNGQYLATSTSGRLLARAMRMSSAASTIDPLNPELWNQVYGETPLRESGWLELFKAWQKLLPLGVATITILTVNEEGGGKGEHFMYINNYKSSKHAIKDSLHTHTHTLRESEREKERESERKWKRARERESQRQTWEIQDRQIRE